MTSLYIHTFHTFHNYHGGSGNLTATQSCLLILLAFYISYLLIVCMLRGFRDISRNKFILYLVVPFLGCFVWFFKLFKND